MIKCHVLWWWWHWLSVLLWGWLHVWRGVHKTLRWYGWWPITLLMHLVLVSTIMWRCLLLMVHVLHVWRGHPIAGV